jgi:type I restriction enzyme S subunit
VIINIDACIHDGFVIFRNYNEKINTHFLYYLLKKSTKSLTEGGQSGTQKNLNTGIINNFQIFFPPLPEQQAIAQILSDMDTEIEALEQKRDKYRALKQGMMQELLTGKTRLV